MKPRKKPMKSSDGEDGRSRFPRFNVEAKFQYVSECYFRYLCVDNRVKRATVRRNTDNLAGSACGRLPAYQSGTVENSSTVWAFDKKDKCRMEHIDVSIYTDDQNRIRDTYIHTATPSFGFFFRGSTLFLAYKRKNYSHFC